MYVIVYSLFVFKRALVSATFPEIHAVYNTAKPLMKIVRKEL